MPALTLDSTHEVDQDSALTRNTARFEDSVTIEDALHRQLRQCGRSQLGEVTGDCDGMRCRLTGRVPSFFLKQMAQEIARGIEEIEQIDNRVQVVEAEKISIAEEAS